LVCNLYCSISFAALFAAQGEALELLEAHQAKGHLDEALGVDAQISRLGCLHAVGS